MRLRRRPGSADRGSSGATAVATATPSPPAVHGQRDAADAVSWPVRATAAWSWRFVAIALAGYVGLIVVGRLTLIVYSVLVALLLAALLAPGVDRLGRWGLGRAPAAVAVFLGGILAVVGIFTALGAALVTGLPEIAQNALEGIQEIQDWLVDGPLGIGEEQLQRYLEQAQNLITDNQAWLTTGALGAAGAAGTFFAGLALMLFTTFFFLYDGGRIWAWTARLLPRSAEAPVDEAGRAAWGTLVGYVRGLVLIAFIDAVGIGAILFLVGVPLAIPLAILVFFGAFVPIVGALVTGALAALVALVTNGLIAALIVLAGIIVVQQLEGNVLQPLIMSRSVAVHPLGVVLAVTAGSLLAGIGGAVVAVPIAAVVNTALTVLSGRDRPPDQARPPQTTP